jgi:hypothetical protein
MFDIKALLNSLIGTTSENDGNNTATVNDIAPIDDVERTQVSVVASVIAPAKRKRYHYFDIERSNAINSTDLNKFEYLINVYPAIIRKGILNTLMPIKNITSMRLAHLYLTFKNVTTQYLFKHKRLNLLIDELAAQSFIGNNNIRFHFVLEYIDTINNFARFSAYEFNRGIFEFDNPIRYLDKITISLYDGTNLFSLEPNIYMAIPSSSTTFTLITLPDDFLYTYVPEEITISDFMTSTPVIDAALIAAINTSHTSYLTLRQVNNVSAQDGLIQIFIDNMIYIINYSSSSLPPGMIQIDLLSVDKDVIPNTLTSVINAFYQTTDVTSNNYNNGYFDVLFDYNLGVLTITITTTDGIINSQLIRTFAAGVYTDTLTSVNSLYCIRLPVDSSAATITSPTVTIAAQPAKLEARLELITEEDTEKDFDNM